MTRDEAKAAIDEIYRRTGYGATLTLEEPEMYHPTIRTKRYYINFWRVTYSIFPHEYHEDASEPEQAILAALNHVRKELGE